MPSLTDHREHIRKVLHGCTTAFLPLYKSIKSCIKILGSCLWRESFHWEWCWYVVRWCFAVLNVRCSVSDAVFCSLVISLVMPCLDYNNAILTGLPASQICQLHSVLNAVTRLIYWSQFVAAMLWDLHWFGLWNSSISSLAVLVCGCLVPMSNYIQHVVADCSRLCLQSLWSSQLELLLCSSMSI